MVDAWQTAVQLAYNHCKDRLDEALHVVSRRMALINRHKDAAKMFENMDKWEEAVDMYVQGGEWEKAQTIADRLGEDTAEKVHLVACRIPAPVTPKPIANLQQLSQQTVHLLGQISAAAHKTQEKV